MFHIWKIDTIFWRLWQDNMSYLQILQYIVSWLIISNYFIWKAHLKSPNKKRFTDINFNTIILIIVSIYAFIASNIYILDIFENIFWHFSLTIYWWIIASSLLFYGISKDIWKFRTIWLYFIVLTSAKIFLFDVWQLGDTNSKVIAFMGLWILFITISTFYTKKYWNNIMKELSFDNLKDGKSGKVEIVKK